MKKQTQTMEVIMLPTDKVDSNIYLDNLSNRLYLSNYTIKTKNPQHLYIVSDNPIKEGDWYIAFSSTAGEGYKPFKCGPEYHTANEMKVPKIEATTDSSLYFIGKVGNSADIKIMLPQIPQSFVEVYAKSNGTIKEVQVEIELWANGNRVKDQDSLDYYTRQLAEFEEKIKTRPDNTIIIHPCREYTKAKVIVLLNAYRSKFLVDNSISEHDKWIEENL